MLLHRSCNFVPEEIRNENNFRKISAVAKVYFRWLILFLGIVFLLECGGIWWFSGVTVPRPLEDEYQKAKVDIEVIKKEFGVIEKAAGEDQAPLAALYGLLKDRPPEIGFNRLEIGQSDGKKGASEWISLEGVGTDPIIFRDYALKLNQNPVFANATISKIDSNQQNNIKTATIKAGKGK